MPDASPGSIGASAPARRDVRNDETRWMRLVAANASGADAAHARICGPVNRSNARDPVRAASASSLPTALAISRQAAVVLESIHTGGDIGR